MPDQEFFAALNCTWRASSDSSDLFIMEWPPWEPDPMVRQAATAARPKWRGLTVHYESMGDGELPICTAPSLKYVTWKEGADGFEVKEVKEARNPVKSGLVRLAYSPLIWGFEGPQLFSLVQFLDELVTFHEVNIGPADEMLLLGKIQPTHHPSKQRVYGISAFVWLRDPGIDNSPLLDGESIANMG